ncbi:GNAT family N-acetyltransferase [Oryzifoliimicrobium ureilyticus]|uniref:GNAT family N-acetyltransferase n=1 Tax=Oryzifoliimicrobium ureilyticus TaxID=3113724 RepID=UPI0030764C0C
MVDIATIETERLVLRAHCLEDFDAYHALWSDPSVVRYIGGTPSTVEQTWARLIKAAGHWHHLGFGFLAIEEKDSGALIGEAGFHEVKRAMTPSIIGTLETGWLLAPQYQGRGYAREAMRALISWGEQRFPSKSMTAIIHPANDSSLKLAHKLGFQEVTRTDYNGDVILLERPSSRG